MGDPPFGRPTISLEHAVEKLGPPKAMDFTFSPVWVFLRLFLGWARTCVLKTDTRVSKR